MDKLAGVTEMLISLNELNNSDNLDDGKPSNVLLRYHMTSSEEFTNFEPVTPQYKKLKNLKFTSITLRIMDQNGNIMTDGSGVTIMHDIQFISFFKMEYGNKLNPEHSLRTPLGMKGTRQKVIVTHNPSEIDQK